MKVLFGSFGLVLEGTRHVYLVPNLHSRIRLCHLHRYIVEPTCSRLSISTACCGQLNKSHTQLSYLCPTMTLTVINDLSVAISAEVVTAFEEILAGRFASFGNEAAGVPVTLIKDGVRKNAPLTGVIYASEVFPEVLKTLQTIINDLAGTATAEVQVPGPGGNHVLKRKDIPSESSYTFALGRIGVDLVVIYEGKPARFLLDGGKQVKYVSELFPSAGSS